MDKVKHYFLIEIAPFLSPLSREKKAKQCREEKKETRNKEKVEKNGLIRKYL
jgi:hypothetical protein